MGVNNTFYSEMEMFGTPYRWFGSVRFGASVVVMDSMFPGMHRLVLVDIGRLAVSYGPAGSIEDAQRDMSPNIRGRHRVFRCRNGAALAINWETRR